MQNMMGVDDGWMMAVCWLYAGCMLVSGHGPSWILGWLAGWGLVSGGL